jgi:hypothetical protein
VNGDGANAETVHKESSTRCEQRGWCRWEWRLERDPASVCESDRGRWGEGALEKTTMRRGHWELGHWEL